MSWELKVPAVQLKGTDCPGAVLSAGPVSVMNGCPAAEKGTCLHAEGGMPPALHSLSEALCSQALWTYYAPWVVPAPGIIHTDVNKETSKYIVTTGAQ